MGVKRRWATERARTGGSGREITIKERDHATTSSPARRARGRGFGRSARAQPTQPPPKRGGHHKKEEEKKKMCSPLYVLFLPSIQSCIQYDVDFVNIIFQVIVKANGTIVLVEAMMSKE